MKINLFKFQKEALDNLREKLVSARSFASDKSPQALSFSSPTGSGKTVMMTALFEAILDEPDEQLEWPLDWQSQPDAVILWVSDMPELNEQTRKKIESQSDKVHRVNQLETIDANFDAEQLSGGKIYFINTQKLAKNQPLTNYSDDRKYLIWQTLNNTAQAFREKFYVVIDEAHRGMNTPRAVRTAQTIMQRFLLGYKEVGLDPVPFVIGISATPKRFTNLLENAEHTLHKVIVPTESVRESGLLKDRVVIHHPDEVTKAEMALLAEAARKWESLRLDWEKYCESEQEKIVKPILVVQIENGTKTRLSKTDLSDAITAIENSTGRRLTSKEMAHAMHDTGDLVISERVVRRVDASKIEHDKNIGVVFFKTSLSTGWDCPRAEVMMSFRKAEDHTYIAQLLGRMVRTPLARRVEKNASLNDVHLYLPYFDEDAVQSVIDSLRNTEEVPPSETGSSKNLVILEKSEAMEQVFKFLSDLPTYRVNASRAQSPLRRYFSLARQLTLDDINTASWGEAKSKITSWMANEVNRLKEAGEFEKIARTVSYVDLSTISITNNGENVVEGSGYQVSSSNIDIDRLFEESGRALGNGLHMDFWRSTVNRSRPAFDVKVEAITVSRSKNSLKNLELLAETQFNELYDAHKREINSLKESRKVNYETLRLATAEPVEVSWTLPENIAFSISDDSLSFAKHLYVDKEGQFFTELGPWELEVIKEELANNSVIGWLRNLPRKPWSFEIPYESGGAIRPMFPDIITVRQEADNLVVDIIEPHDPSLSDNFEKAKGLAQFAEKHGHRFGRIELVRKKGNHFYRLDLNKTSNIKDVLLVTSNPQLDKIFEYSAT